MKLLPTVVLSLAPDPTRRIAGGREIGRLYQHRCVESWRSSGFNVCSVNVADEADAVRAAYPDVPIFAAERDMSGICGRPLVPVSEMLRVLQATGASWGGIASADVQAPEPGLVRPWSEMGPEAVFLDRAGIAHPCDAPGLPDPSGPFAVLFEVRRAAVLDVDPFTIGLPGWGRALATALLLGGASATYPPDVLLTHLDHPGRCGDDLHRHFFDAFRTRFSPELEALRMTDRGAALPSLAALADQERHAASYAERAARRGATPDLTVSARRYRAAYAAAVADVIRDLSATPSRGDVPDQL